MNSLRYCLLPLAYTTALLLLGCTQPQSTGGPPDVRKAQAVAAELQSQLAEARKDIAKQHAQNSELIERVQSVMDKLKEVETAREREREERKAVAEETSRKAAASGISDPVRIKLMGAKALAEFRAKQLGERLDKLGKDLEQKEQELKTIRENAQKKDEEVQALTKRIEELRATKQEALNLPAAEAERLGQTPPIPPNSIDKPPSAELRPDQRDDQSLPPYEVLDPILQLYVEDDRTAGEIIELGHDEQMVRRITRLVDIAEYKRRQTPPGVRVSRKAFGKDRRLPITNGYRG